MIEAEWTFIAVDQFSKPIETVRRRGWHKIGSDPTIEVNPSTDRVTVLGAVTHEGESFYCWTEENLTGKHGVRLVSALQSRFGDEIVVCLDQAPYFYTTTLWEFVTEEEETEYIDETSIERVHNDTLQVWYFPPRLPELNPVEQCWTQLDAWFNYRLIEDLEELQTELLTALSEIDTPNLFNYLLPEEAREQTM